MKIKFTCNRTGFKKTFTVKDSLFNVYCHFHNINPITAQINLAVEVQKVADSGLHCLVSGRYLNEFMRSSLES
jgi:hypothetical protein